MKVWAEPGVVEAAAFEFSETEVFLAAAEALTCPYEWTRYDVLCLPPSFPYGGMGKLPSLRGFIRSPDVIYIIVNQKTRA